MKFVYKFDKGNKANKTVRVFALCPVVCLIFLCGNTFAAGIPTVDAAAVTQAVLTLEQLRREYDQLVRTYENQVRHFNAITGIRDISRLINSGGKFTEFLPESLKTSIQNLGRCGASAMTPEVRSLYNKFAMGDRCARYTTRFKETCYARAAVDATRLYSGIAGAEAARKIADELKQKSEQGFAKADDLKGGAELIAANQQYKANLELMRENYSKNMRTLDEQLKLIGAKEDLLRAQALFGRPEAEQP